MSIPVEKMSGLLSRLAQVFGLPAERMAGTNEQAWAEMWVNLLGDYTEAEVFKAARHLALTLKRFPYPADFVEVIFNSKNLAQINPTAEDAGNFAGPTCVSGAAQ